MKLYCVGLLITSCLLRYTSLTLIFQINGKKKLVHAGAVGYGNNYSDKARRAFKSRHNCKNAKPGTARHLACTALWRKGGRKTANPRN